MQVAESTDDVPISVSSRFSCFYSCWKSMKSIYEIAKATWRRFQIGHRGKYSVERLQALKEYCRNTSRCRLVTVTALTPVPALLLVIGLESIPLRDPKEGWKANYASWIRLHIMSFTIAMGLVFQIKGLVVGLSLSHRRAMSVAALTSCCHSAIMIAVSSMWVFPLPFGIVLSVIPFVTLFVLFFLLAIGRRAFETVPELGRQLRRQIYIVVAQAVLVLVYPSFNALYLVVPPHHQAGLVMLLPLMKIIMKNFVAWSSGHLEEFVPEVVVFSVEVFNALYVAICMQTAGSMTATIAILAFDAVNSALAVRSIHYETTAIQALQARYRSRGLLQNVINICNQPDVFNVRQSAAISLQSPIRHHLSGEDNVILATMMRRRSLSQNILAIPQGVAVRNASPASPSVQFDVVRHPLTKVVPNELALASLLGSTNTAQLSRSEEVEMVHETLKLLFHCEYLVLVEYIECAIPLLYAIYLSILLHLPNSKYYPHTKDMTEDRLVSTVSNLVVYVWLEVLSFLGLHIVLKRKFDFSPAYLLGFVLETQASQLQGRLFVWIIYILQFTLVHFGVDFTFQFKWIEESNDADSQARNGSY